MTGEPTETERPTPFGFRLGRSVSVGSPVIQSRDVVRNLSVILDMELSMKRHASNSCRGGSRKKYLGGLQAPHHLGGNNG